MRRTKHLDAYPAVGLAERQPVLREVVTARTTRIGMIVVGVVALAALAKTWLRPGDLYVPEVPEKP